MGSVGKSEYKRHTLDKDRIICRILHGCLSAGHAEQLDPQTSHMSKHLKREEDDRDEGFMLMIIDQLGLLSRILESLIKIGYPSRFKSFLSGR